MIVPPFPLPPGNYETAFFARVLEAVRASFSQAVGKTEAVDSVLLQDPDGGVWKVSVDNTGTIQTEAVPLGR